MTVKLEIENLQKSVLEYLERTLGAAVQMNSAEQSKKARLLPVYLDRSYRFFYGTIQGQTLTFAFATEPDVLTPGRLKKDAAAVANVLGYPVVFVLERLEAHHRTRLIQQKIAFLVPGKQLHIPFLVISLTDPEEKFRLPKLEKLRPASQVLLLYHLGKERLDSDNYQTIAQKIGYSAMTVRRAAEELEAYQLARKEGKGEKFIRFAASGRELWDKALTYLASPVKISYAINQLPKDVMLKKAGITALSNYTELALPAQSSYALYEVQRKAFEKKLQPFEIEYFGGGNIEIEIWNYDPGILSQGDSVDPLSLYLSISSYNQDERTLLAKEELINKYTW
ncbi:hypothetical protein Q4E93_34375 [Flavitalea sp. BT771]|uniref:hypothetical protein n=1 Tax=Flavitalea sp. BT771 TaxID=3063329 RepID=UPI0026E452AA|nr:hypothetical protein [Flavitalea sp. BT771]MDO6435752.1 hypothetical protein [Flavitalea sp. BT771]MDV6224653.1 hypothetical protein [Flavitalea sp. BT771]